MSTGASEVTLIQQLTTELQTVFTTLQTELANQDNPAVDAALTSLQGVVTQIQTLSPPATGTPGATADNPPPTA